MKKSMMMSLIFIFLIAPNALAWNFDVEHEHLLRNCKGKLVFGDTTVEYIAGNKEDARIWKYENIQQLAIAPAKISILTYNTTKIEFGADRVFNFKVIAGIPDDQFRKDMETRLSRPLVSSILPEHINMHFSIPARHRLFMSDSQGVLEFGEDYVIYRAEKQKDSQAWRYDELLSLGSTGPFQLRLGALQKTGGEYGEEKNYVFDLKRQLVPEEYDFIWEKINRRKIESGR
jgi:hypothetical protein